MKIIETGHIYQLQNKIIGSQELIFFKDLPKDEKGHDGILNQELF